MMNILHKFDYNKEDGKAEIHPMNSEESDNAEIGGRVHCPYLINKNKHSKG